MFNELSTFFDNMWNNFSRPVKDMQPFSVYQNEDKGYILVVNTLGINKEDLTVNLENEKGSLYPILKIKGETTIEKINFSNKVNLGIQLKIKDKVEAIDYTVNNGLTIIYLKIKKPEKETLTARPLDDLSQIDW